MNYQFPRHILILSSLISLYSCSISPVSTNNEVAAQVYSDNQKESGQIKVDITINNNLEYQTIEGFGATHIPLYHENKGDVLGEVLRKKGIDAVYNQIGISMGNLEGPLLESPGSYSQRTNDNSDPYSINWKGFQTFRANVIKSKLVNLAEPLGFNNYFPSQKINVRWSSPWLKELRQSNYQRYLDEIGEQVLAGITYWLYLYGSAPRYLMLFNEPLSGNRELLDGNTQDVVNIIKSVGGRLQAEGYLDIKFIVANEETVKKSLQTITAILSDPAARVYVGAIGYHTYPYGSVYSSIPRILASSGIGKPDKNEIIVRNKLHKIAREYNLPVWMTEVSHGKVDPRSFDNLRGRAIHIHDELIYANASAYFGMNNMWDVSSHEMHYKGRSDADIFAQEGTMILIENNKNIIHITGMGYAIGHYARWIKKGAIRIEAKAGDPLILATAFRHDENGQLVIVLINNHKAEIEKTVNVKINGLQLKNNLQGEQSTSLSNWMPLEVETNDNSTTFVIKLPGESVTTLAGSFLLPSNY